jgi:hypothetical protein
MRTKIKKRVKLPISKTYYYSWQIEEYRKVKSKHGKRHADKWFESKFGR